MTLIQSHITCEYRQQIDTYWAGFLGCNIEALNAGGYTIVRQPASRGLFYLHTDDSQILSLHPDCIWTYPRTAPTLAQIRQTLAPLGTVDEVYGPGEVMYCTPETFCPADEQDCRQISSKDHAALERFACEVEWTCFWQPASDVWDYTFGIFRNHHLVSAAAIIIWGDTIGAVRVATLPAYQGQGFGRAVTSRATCYMLTQTNLIPQYDTLVSNIPSRHVAQALGFQHYGQFYYGTIMQHTK